MMVQSFVAAFAKAARVSDVPEEAIMSGTREPSYMFLAAEWNRSSVSERAYLLAMLFGREVEVEANDLSLQIASLAQLRRFDPSLRDFRRASHCTPGIGRLLYEGIFQRDFPLVQGVVMEAGIMIVVINLTIDILYAYIDPRIRLSK